MPSDVRISLDGLLTVPTGFLNGHAAEPSAALTQLSMNAPSRFCLPATILVLMAKHLSLSRHAYSSNRCEPFKEGCIMVPKGMRLMSLGRAAWRLLIARGLGPLLRSSVKGLGTQEAVLTLVSNPRPMEKRNSS